ncbi:MAG: hypothetical protein L6R35_002829 [Caloplaca aegaea]|nr:MAG: hypothetical protein L6R35_002829 [Caloplaca aegaea]
MEAVIHQAKHLADTSDELGRKKLIDEFRDLSYSLETPDETLHRIIYSETFQIANTKPQHLQISIVRIGVDLKLFDLIAASERPMTVDELQIKTGRLLRYLASVAMIAEVGQNTFGSTNVTEVLAIPGSQAGIHHMFDMIGPIYQELPDFLARKKYQDITDSADTAHQAARKSPLPAFLWFAENPQAGAFFNEYMLHRRKGMATWIDVYPLEDETKGWDSEKAVFVDIGGNLGHQCAELKKKYPHLPGKVILQDLDYPISRALDIPGVQKMVHDAFEPQPVKGSKFYYLRAVLHDWSDDKCRTMLGHIMAAMGPDSVILLDEMVLPDTEVHWQCTQVDLTMMAGLASWERTHSQWAELLGSIGLKIAKTYTYTPSVYESVMHVVRE